jgi:hypothetical protein
VSWVEGILERDGNSRVGLGPSSEVGTRLRGSRALERGGNSPDGASSPRVRRKLARGGVKPSSEAEVLWCGAWPSSETEVRPRGDEAGYLMDR